MDNTNMLMHSALLLSLSTPLIAALILLFSTLLSMQLNEKTIVTISKISFGIHLVGTLLCAISWMAGGMVPLEWNLAVPYRNGDYQLAITLYLDLASTVFLITTALIANIIIHFSSRYMHRDPGFRRFFSVISLFIFGMTLIICAGSFDLIFIGWEIVGLSSFLLIGFFWQRPQAVINAKRAFFIFRFCDLGLLASAMLSHLIFHKNDLFFSLSSGHLIDSWAHTPLWQQWALSAVIILPVIGKSAQFPVCYWLPRAMEGPTPSSAIFYGSLSIHSGVFLLLRTYSLWSNTPYFPLVVAGIGLTTAILATLCARVQSNIKGQIGYASIAQVGLILIELSCGFLNLALMHTVGNAALRCFQLLISPSIVAQQLQIHNALEGKIVSNRWAIEHWIPQSWRHSLFILALNDGYLEVLVDKFFIRPWVLLARYVNHFFKVLFLRYSEHGLLAPSSTQLLMRSSLALPLIFLLIMCISVGAQDYAAPFFLIISILLAFMALGETHNFILVVNAVGLSNFSGSLAFTLNDSHALSAIFFYLIGLFASWLVVESMLIYVRERRVIAPLTQFSGLSSQFPLASTLALLGILGMNGFPLSSTFFAEDIITKHAFESGWHYALGFNLIFVINGISLIKLYSSIFLGKRDAEVDEIHLDISKWNALTICCSFIAMNMFAFYITNY